MSKSADHYIMRTRYEDYGEGAVQCAACDEQLWKFDAFYDSKNRQYYHGICAGMYRCENCGEWNEKGRPCVTCGAKPS